MRVSTGNISVMALTRPGAQNTQRGSGVALERGGSSWGREQIRAPSSITQHNVNPLHALAEGHY